MLFHSAAVFIVLSEKFSMGHNLRPSSRAYAGAHAACNSALTWREAAAPICGVTTRSGNA